MTDLTGKLFFMYRLLKGRVLDQLQQGTNCINPYDNRCIDTEDNPHALGITERMRQFTKTNRCRHIADKVKGMKNTHVPGIAVSIMSGNQRQTQHGDRISTISVIKGRRMRRKTR